MDFDSVGAEKEDAMRRYNRQRNLKTFVHFASLFLVLLLLYSCSTPRIPAAMEIAGECFFSLKSVLYQRQYVFLLMNAILLAIYVSNNKNADAAHPDMYDEYLSKSAASNIRFPASKMKFEVVNRNSGSPVIKTGNTTSAIVVVTECSAPATECEIKVTETGRRYRRTQSERRTVAEVREELRRSETENGRQSMEEMSGEEFRIIVESFIAKKRMDLREQDINMPHSHSGEAEPRQC